MMRMKMRMRPPSKSFRSDDGAEERMAWQRAMMFGRVRSTRRPELGGPRTKGVRWRRPAKPHGLLFRGFVIKRLRYVHRRVEHYNHRRKPEMSGQNGASDSQSGHQASS